MYSNVWLLSLALLAIGFYFYFKLNRQRHLGIDRKLNVFIQALNDCAFYQEAVINQASLDEFTMTDIHNRECIKLKVSKDKLLCHWEYYDGKKSYIKNLNFHIKMTIQNLCKSIWLKRF